MESAQRAALRSALIVALGWSAGCGPREASNKIAPVYDKQTGELRLLKYDSNGDGKVDTWSYMAGIRVQRIEIDRDEDGKLDRWEYYGADQKLEKTGISRASDGIEDAWLYSGPDGGVVRVDVSTKRDGKATRRENYQKDKLVSAEEDTDEDGKADKWETYEGDRLKMVAFDTLHRGTPDRRLIYAADGSSRLEVDAGDGKFVAPEAPR
jgi:hypothetical protein